MHCPYCQHENTRVTDSRVSDDGATIRRRRGCEACGERFSTLETIELKLPAIIKSDGSRQPFDARKLRQRFDRALHKRPVSQEQVEAALRAVIHDLRMTAERELPARRIGEFVMQALRRLDQVAFPDEQFLNTTRELGCHIDLDSLDSPISHSDSFWQRLRLL